MKDNFHRLPIAFLLAVIAIAAGIVATPESDWLLWLFDGSAILAGIFGIYGIFLFKQKKRSVFLLASDIIALAVVAYYLLLVYTAVQGFSNSPFTF